MRDFFNIPNDRRGTHSAKWDLLESKFDVDAEDGLAMWTADSDYPTAPCVMAALQEAVDHGVFGYFADFDAYHAAIQWWMKTRHGWEIDTDWILTSQGLGNAIALCVDVWTDPGDRVVTFNPVYHEFEWKVRRAGRTPVQCEMPLDGDTYRIDFDAAQAQLDGTEKLLIFCSPQNPSGRIWTQDELRQVAEFAARNDLIVIADEIHHDFIYPGQTFVPFDVAAPDARERLVVLTASSKTFNIAGQKTGNMIIPDAKLRERLRSLMTQRLRSLRLFADATPWGFFKSLVTAPPIPPRRANWPNVDAQIDHLIENRRIFDEAVNAIPGVRSLPLASTYLAWVDFSGTGMSFEAATSATGSDKESSSRHSRPVAGPEFGPGGVRALHLDHLLMQGNIGGLGGFTRRWSQAAPEAEELSAQAKGGNQTTIERVSNMTWRAATTWAAPVTASRTPPSRTSARGVQRFAIRSVARLSTRAPVRAKTSTAAWSSSVISVTQRLS